MSLQSLCRCSNTPSTHVVVVYTRVCVFGEVFVSLKQLTPNVHSHSRARVFVELQLQVTHQALKKMSTHFLINPKIIFLCYLNFFFLHFSVVLQTYNSAIFPSTSRWTISHRNDIQEHVFFFPLSSVSHL